MNSESSLKRIHHVVDHVKVAMLVTVNENCVMRSRPMQVAKVDDDGSFWFFTDEYAGKTEDLRSDYPVLLNFSDAHHKMHLSISGRSYIVEDEHKMATYWNPILNNWFPGKTKEQLVMIKIVPESAEYWEESDSVWKQMFYAGKAIISGDSYSRGNHEKVNIT